MHNYHKIFPPKSKAATLFYDIHIGMALVCIPIILFKCFHSLSLLSLPGISMNSKPPKSQLFWKVWGFCLSNSYTNAFLLFLPLSLLNLAAQKQVIIHTHCPPRLPRPQDLSGQRSWSPCSWVGGGSWYTAKASREHLGIGTKCLTNQLDLNCFLKNVREKG